MDQLPPELISQIVAFLPRNDVPVVRQVSRHIERSCFDYFAHLYFRKRGFFITTDSLQVLECISQHDGLRKHVQHVWFNPDCYTFVENTPSSWTLYEGDDILRTEEQAMLFDRYVSDHQDLLYGTRLQMKLAGIVKRFPILKTMGMRRGEGHRPYLWRTMYREVGLDPRTLGSESRLYASSFADPTYLFVAIVKAIAAGQRRIRRLYTDAIQIDYLDHDLLPSETECKIAFESIHYLEINATGPPTMRDLDGEQQAIGIRTTHSRKLESILGSIPELFEIGMTIFRDPKLRHMIPPDPRRLQSWSETYPYRAFESISANIELRHLRRIKLEKLCTTLDVLSGFLRPCLSVLMSLKLRYIQLLDNGEDVLEASRSFIRLLSTKCQSMEYLLLNDLSCNGLSIRFPTDHLRLDPGRFVVGEESPALELLGLEEVKAVLSTLADKLKSVARVLTSDPDDVLWYTDTSDEDW